MHIINSEHIFKAHKEEKASNSLFAYLNELDQGSANSSPLPDVVNKFFIIKMAAFIHLRICLCLLTYLNSRVEWLQHKPCGPQSLKYLLTGFLQNKFSDP